MNPAEGENKTVKMLSRFPWEPIKRSGKLNFYSFDQTIARGLHQQLEKQVGQISYLSLKGKKDLIMKSTDQTLPLYHIQHGLMREAALGEAINEGTYMICSSENSELDEFFKKTASGFGHSKRFITQNQSERLEFHFDK